MKVGVIGLGRIGRVHINALQSINGITVHSISDINEEVCKKTAKEFNIPNYNSNFKFLLDDGKLDAIWVCSPSNLHYLHVSEALKRNKYVFCEKPLETEKHKIERLIAEFPNIDRQLMVGFNRRFDPNFAFVKNNIQQVGKPTIIKITSRDPAPPSIAYIKKSGGIFNDMTIHDFDMALFIADSEITEVYATGAVNYVPEMKGIDIDTALITLTFKNGIICTIDNSRKSAYGYDQRLEVMGDQGMLKVDNKKINQCNVYTENNVSHSVFENFFLDRYKEAYGIECQTFFEHVKQKKKLPVTAKDALRALELAEAAKESLKNSLVITL